MKQPSIRVATLGDVAEIAEVHVATWQSAYKGLLPDKLLQNLSVENRKRSWQRILNNSPSVPIVAEIENQVVGFSNFGASRDSDAAPTVGEIYAIYLLAAYWGQGIGKALMQTSLRQLATGGFDSTTLWVLKSNQRTIDFYSGMGFSPDGETKAVQWGEFVLHEIRMLR